MPARPARGCERTGVVGPDWRAHSLQVRGQTHRPKPNHKVMEYQIISCLFVQFISSLIFVLLLFSHWLTKLCFLRKNNIMCILLLFSSTKRIRTKECGWRAGIYSSAHHVLIFYSHSDINIPFLLFKVNNDLFLLLLLEAWWICLMCLGLSFVFCLSLYLIGDSVWKNCNIFSKLDNIYNIMEKFHITLMYFSFSSHKLQT